MKRVKAETTKAVDVVVVQIIKLRETLISSGVIEELVAMIIEVVEEKTTIIPSSSNDRIRKKIDVAAVMVRLAMRTCSVLHRRVAARLCYLYFYLWYSQLPLLVLYLQKYK